MLRNGRLMAVIAVREPSVSGIQNYAVYSDDEGEKPGAFRNVLYREATKPKLWN